MTPEAWTAAATITVAAFGFAGVVVQQAQQTRRALQRVGTRVDAVAKTTDAVAKTTEAVAKTTEDAKQEASTAARQTVATGNGHASRVEGGLAQVLERMVRMEELVTDVRSEVGAELRGVRADVAAVNRAITDHLQDHAGADVRRAG